MNYYHKVITRFCQTHFKFQNKLQSLHTWNGTKYYKRGIYEQGIQRSTCAFFTQKIEMFTFFVFSQQIIFIIYDILESFSAPSHGNFMPRLWPYGPTQ